MNKLPENFTLHRYGIDARFVNIEDSEFILSLRTSKRGMILNKTDNDLLKQIEWMKEYKIREAKGLDYYFIHYYQGQPVGVNRIYNIDYENQSCVTGSWVIKEGTDYDISLKTMLILREVVFELMNAEISFGDTRKCNKPMQRLYKMLGIEMIGETEEEYLYKSIKGKYLYGQNKIKKLIGMTE